MRSLGNTGRPTVVCCQRPASWDRKEGGRGGEKPTNAIDSPPIRHQPDIVIEHAARMEQRDREPGDPLQRPLHPLQQPPVVRDHLLVQFVLAKAQDRDDACVFTDRNLQEPTAALHNQRHAARGCFQRLLRPAEDNGDGAAGGRSAQQRFAGTPRDAGEAHGQEVVAVEGHAEVRVERQQRGRDAWEERLEAGCALGAEVAEGAVADDAVRVVGEDVVALRVEVGALVQLHREVTRVEPPQREPPQEVRAPLRRGAVDVRVREEAVQQVRHEHGPRERDCEQEPEQRDVQRDGEFVEEHGGRLEPTLQRDFQRRDADPAALLGCLPRRRRPCDVLPVVSRGLTGLHPAPSPRRRLRNAARVRGVGLAGVAFAVFATGRGGVR